jgi:hypothetical protein
MEARTSKSYIKDAHTHEGPEGSHTHTFSEIKCGLWKCDWNDRTQNKCDHPMGCDLVPDTFSGHAICKNFKDGKS